MGTSSSKFKESGTLPGASCLPTIPTMPLPLEGPRELIVRVPPGKQSGDTIRVESTLTGKSYMVTIPKRPNGKNQVEGESFKYRDPGDVNRVMASTRSSIPGFRVVEQKPIVWSTVARAFSQSKESTNMIHMTGPLLQEAQEGLIE